MAMKKNKILCVLGMHRTGTSCLARGLGALGFNLGNDLSDFYVDSLEDNKKGFCEDNDFNNINVELMSLAGVEWSDCAKIELNKISSNALDYIFNHAVDVIGNKIANSDGLVLKNPRMVRLMPFWKAVFSFLAVDVFYVISYRHPASVMMSLKKRNGFNKLKSYYLWLVHEVAAIRETEGESRIVVNYDSLIDQPEIEMRRLAEALDVKWCPFSEQVLHYMKDFLENDLRHTKYSSENFDDIANFPKDVISTALMLESIAKGKIDIDSHQVFEFFKNQSEKLDDMSFELSQYSSLQDCGSEGEAHRVIREPESVEPVHAAVDLTGHNMLPHHIRPVDSQEGAIGLREVESVSSEEIIVDGVNIFINGPGSYERYKDREDVFYMAKSKGFVDSYLDIFGGKSVNTILEVGTFRGGGTVFLHRLFNPAKLVTIDIYDYSVAAFNEYVSNARDVIKPYHFSQSSVEDLVAVIEREFPQGIDLVVDDASHFYEESKATFEAVFPYVVNGGSYVIENWSWSHEDTFQTPGNIWEGKRSLTNLIFEILMLQGSHGGIIHKIESVPGFINIVRGGYGLNRRNFKIDGHIKNRGMKLGLI